MRDGAPTIGRAVESILQQTERNFELVVVDDGSRDDTAQVVRRFADSRIQLTERPPLGLVAALQEGLRTARAPLIARMDADDWSDPRRLRLQADFLDAHPEADLVATQVRYGGDAEANQGLAAFVDWTNQLLTHSEIALRRFVESPIVHPSVMFRRAIVERAGGYREGEFPEDYELWLRWLAAGARFAKLDEELLDWSDRPERLTRADPRYSVEAFFRTKTPYLYRWLAENNPLHPRVVVWGAGRTTRRRLQPLLKLGIEVSAWVDVDVKKIGWTVAGAPVWSPDELPEPGGVFVLSAVGKRDARPLIEAALTMRGYELGRHWIACA